MPASKAEGEWAVSVLVAAVWAHCANERGGDGSQRSGSLNVSKEHLNNWTIQTKAAHHLALKASGGATCRGGVTVSSKINNLNSYQTECWRRSSLPCLLTSCFQTQPGFHGSSHLEIKVFGVLVNRAGLSRFSPPLHNIRLSALELLQCVHLIMQKGWIKGDSDPEGGGSCSSSHSFGWEVQPSSLFVF